MDKFNWVRKRAPVADGTPGSWLMRDSGVGLEFHGWLWISDGYRIGGDNTKDMLRSATGYDFLVQRGFGGSDPSNVPYSPYAPISVHVFADVGERMIVVDKTAIKISEDGTNWTNKFTGTFPYQVEGRLFSFKNKLILLRSNDIQVSLDDGQTWNSCVAPWQPRGSYSAAIYGDKLYIVAGALEVNTWPREGGYPNKTSLNDVWCTEDGEDWNCCTKEAAFRARMWPGLIEHDGHLYMCGGYDNLVSNADVSYNYDDTWRSIDGKTWERVNCGTSFPQRHAPTMFSRNGRLLMVAGNTNQGTAVQNDIWEMQPA